MALLLLLFVFPFIFFAPAKAYETLDIANVSEPQNNAPFNHTLAFYRLAGLNGNSEYLTHDFIPVGCGANMSVHYTKRSVFGSMTGSPQKPITILTHGYPESSYIWRRVTGTLSERVPLFVVDVSTSHRDQSKSCF